MGEINKKRGRPRNKSTDLSILKATRALMMEFGINNFSMDDVATRAGVSKPTIYLRWKNKEELISDAFGMVTEQSTIPDTGSTLMDLKILLENMINSMSLSFELPSAPHKMVAGMLESPELLNQYKRNYIVPRRKAFATILQRGIQNGEIRDDVNEEILIDLIGGAYFYCMLFKSDNPSDWIQNVFLMMENGITPIQK